MSCVVSRPSYHQSPQVHVGNFAAQREREREREREKERKREKERERERERKREKERERERKRERERDREKEIERKRERERRERREREREIQGLELSQRRQQLWLENNTAQEPTSGLQRHLQRLRHCIGHLLARTSWSLPSTSLARRDRPTTRHGVKTCARSAFVKKDNI
jgi:hypothetical protein